MTYLRFWCIFRGMVTTFILKFRSCNPCIFFSLLTCFFDPIVIRRLVCTLTFWSQVHFTKVKGLITVIPLTRTCSDSSHVGDMVWITTSYYWNSRRMKKLPNRINWWVKSFFRLGQVLSLLWEAATFFISDSFEEDFVIFQLDLKSM